MESLTNSSISVDIPNYTIEQIENIADMGNLKNLTTTNIFKIKKHSLKKYGKYR